MYALYNQIACTDCKQYIDTIYCENVQQHLGRGRTKKMWLVIGLGKFTIYGLLKPNF